jgi:hypothetical protein
MAPVFSDGCRPATVLALLLLACLLVPPAFAASKKKAPASEAGQNPPGKVTFREAPSHENAAAREKRLKRECRGRPDAGMCRGYTR